MRLITDTDDYYGVSRRDVELARQISAAARKLGLSADPSAVQSVLVIPGSSAPAAVMPFWRAALGYEHRRDNPGEATPRLLHGLDASAWEFVALAAGRGYDMRTGLEDTLTLRSP